MIPNDDKNSQIEVDFFIVKVYAHNLHQKITLQGSDLVWLQVWLISTLMRHISFLVFAVANKLSVVFSRVSEHFLSKHWASRDYAL